MAKKRGPRKKSTKRPVQYSHLAIKVDDHEVSVSAGVNSNVLAPEYAIDLEESDPIFVFGTTLVVFGTGVEPQDKTGHKFELTICSTNVARNRVGLTLKDVQLRDEYGVPQYRKYRKREIPVYQEVKGLSLLTKTRGEDSWTAWVNSTPGVVSNMILVLQSGRDIFVSIHAVKDGRNHWIRQLDLQTIDPELE